MGFFNKKKGDQPPKGDQPATRDTITRWYSKGVAMGASHMFIVQGMNLVTDDEFSDDQPVYLMAGQQLDGENIERTGAVVVNYFDLRIPLEPQLSRGSWKTAKLVTDLQWNDWRPE